MEPYTIMFAGKEFTKIEELPGYYICMETSEVLSTQRNEPYIMKTRVNSKYEPYISVSVVNRKTHRYTNRFIHTLMARTFLKRPEGAKYVRHKNGNIQDNRIENLEWIVREMD